MFSRGNATSGAPICSGMIQFVKPANSGGEQTTIYQAAMRYAADGVPLLVIAGKGLDLGLRLGRHPRVVLGNRIRSLTAAAAQMCRGRSAK
jgi:hypothetical protein